MLPLEERVSRLEAELPLYRENEHQSAGFGVVALALAALAIAWVFPTLRKLDGTGWTAVGALGSWVSGALTAAYVVLTYWLWRDSKRAVEVQIVQSLMEQYDNLRPHILLLRRWYMSAAAAGRDPVDLYSHEIGLDGLDVPEVDESRFLISRLFVRARKLVEAGYLEAELVAKAFGGQAIEDVFLKLVDPLDEVRSGKGSGRADEIFYRRLLSKYPRPRRSSLSVSGE